MNPQDPWIVVGAASAAAQAAAVAWLAASALRRRRRRITTKEGASTVNKTNGFRAGAPPQSEAIARAVARCRDTEAALEAILDDFARIPVEDYDRREREAVAADRHARAELLEILDAIRARPGADSAIVLGDGTVVARSHEGDGLAVARADSVVRLDRPEGRP